MAIIDFNKIRTISKEVEIEKIASYQPIILSLREELKRLGGGAGLAAPQIGQFYRIFIWSKDRREESLKTAINPLFTPLKKFGMQLSIEGCFSIENHFYKLDRWKKIRVTYHDEEGFHHNEILEDFEATVFQHECDHLQGIAIVDKGTLSKKCKDEEGYRHFLEIIKKN